MCNPAVAQFGFQAAGQVGNYMSQRAAVKARNRARLLNFRQDNIAYYMMLFLMMLNGKINSKILKLLMIIKESCFS